jgi:hypothetical protein
MRMAPSLGFPVAPASRPLWLVLVVWALLAVLAVIAVGTVVVWWRRGRRPPYR